MGFFSPSRNAPLLPAKLLGTLNADDNGTFTGASTVMIGGGPPLTQTVVGTENQTPIATAPSPTIKKLTASKVRRWTSPSSSPTKATDSMGSLWIQVQCFLRAATAHQRTTEPTPEQSDYRRLAPLPGTGAVRLVIKGARPPAQGAQPRRRLVKAKQRIAHPSHKTKSQRVGPPGTVSAFQGCATRRKMLECERTYQCVPDRSRIFVGIFH